MFLLLRLLFFYNNIWLKFEIQNMIITVAVVIVVMPAIAAFLVFVIVIF